MRLWAGQLGQTRKGMFRAFGWGDVEDWHIGSSRKMEKENWCCISEEWLLLSLN